MNNRREFLTGLATTAVASAMKVSKAQTGTTDSHSMLAAPAFQPLPLGEIQPMQWLRDQLTVQANGLTGSLEKIFAEVGDSAWIGGRDTHDERGPYYADGLLPLAAALPGNPHINERARYWMEYVLAHQQPNGAIGPYPSSPPRGGDADAIAARKDPDRYNWWPSMPMLKALMQWYEMSLDQNVLKALTAYFKYHAANAASNPLYSWSKMRWIDEIYVMEWTYERTRDPDLLGLAKKLQEQGTDWASLYSNNFPFKAKTVKAQKDMEEHGVNVGQGLKAFAVQYRLANDPDQRANYLAKFNNALALLDTYHGQPSGIFSCDEFLAGREPQQGTELCTVAETLFSLEVGLATFGDSRIADRIEKIAYNALPGLLTQDMWAHQYVGESNQIFSGRMAEWPYATDPGISNMYGLAPRLGCCTANYHQAWPKFTASLWMRSLADGGNGLVAAIIAPSSTTQLLNGVKVNVATVTNYPFDGKVRYVINPDLRSPFRSTSVYPNGQAILRTPSMAPQSGQKRLREPMSGSSASGMPGTPLR